VFLCIYDGIALLVFPFAALSFVLADHLVLLILGPQWRGAIPLFSAFALVAVSLPLSAMTSWLFMSQGRGRDQLHAYLAGGAVTIAAYLVGLRWGALGVVLSTAVTSLTIRLPICYYFAGRSGPLSSSDLWKGFLSYLPSWIAAYSAGIFGRHITAQYSSIVQISICLPLGGTAALASMLAMKRPRSILVYGWRKITGLAKGRIIRSQRSALTPG
jgi:O-antigen/teichoic acid export membrane protein